MSVQRPAGPPARPGTNPLRVLAGVACLAVIVCAVSLTILAWQVIGTRNRVNEVVDRVDRSARDLDPAVRDLRRSARALRQAAGQIGAQSAPSASGG